ncbi:hypothetical protein NH288_08530 [Anaerococcus sp. NML200537]|uniref:hypothetical protein n=1 Tax=Anaerococcus sp. NML200537 TaxID=2954485 RepID=UPI00223743EC|nr:hypothetical protein [Anaerococcus sp. NML200537]MCW6702133.1 hypothetical protein [Anaerococcus sp. NML200537]
MDSKYAKQVNKMLDLGASYPEIRKYLKSKDFNISETYIGKYKRIRQSLTAEENSLEEFINNSPVSKLIESQEKEMQEGSESNKLKSDLEFLDMVIQTGSDQLKTLIKENDYLITIENVFEAIKIKDKLTDGALGGYTNFGIKNLQEITENKYMALIRLMFNYIPTDKKEAALKDLELAEEDYYKQTDYYEEYLRSIGASEKEIQKKLKELKNEKS